MKAKKNKSRRTLENSRRRHLFGMALVMMMVADNVRRETQEIQKERRASES